MADPIALARAAATPPRPIPRGPADAAAPQASGSLSVRGRSPIRDGSVGPGSMRGMSPLGDGARGASPPAGTSPPVPYQALPVRGPVITHNMTAGLPVLDPGSVGPDKVGGERRGGRRRDAGGAVGAAGGGWGAPPARRARAKERHASGTG
jgi:hypothetical protein